MTAPVDEQWKAALLASAVDDAPPPGALDRELARLGVATLVAGSTGAATGAAIDSQPPAPYAGAGTSVGEGGAVGEGAVASKAGGVSGLSVVTKIGVLAVVAATGIAGFLAMRGPHVAAVPPVVSAPHVASHSQLLALPPAVAPLETPAEEAKPTETPPRSSIRDTPSRAGRATPRARPAPTAAPPERAPSLADEVALVDRARSLAQQRPNEALALLEEHASKFPTRRAVLDDEVAVVRLEALLAAGRRAEAERHAAPFLRDRTGTPIARRMSALLAQ